MKTRSRTIGSFEAKTHLSSLIESVEKGDEFIITRRGRPVAKLVPYSSQEDAVKIDEIISRFDSIRNAIRGKVNIKEFIDAGRKF